MHFKYYIRGIRGAGAQTFGSKRQVVDLILNRGSEIFNILIFWGKSALWSYATLHAMPLLGNDKIGNGVSDM